MNPGSIITATLGEAWRGIQRRHREVPEAIVIVGPGDCGKLRKWGHFAPGRWKRRAGMTAETKVEQVHEVLLAGESLERDPADTLGTLIHEAAHALAAARGIKDTSRGGRYHNGRYRKLAEELGLDVQKAGRIGWSATTMRPETIAAYEAEIEALRVAQEQTRQARRRWADETDEKPRKGRTTWACGCKGEDARAFAMSRKAMGDAPIVCSRCEEEFALVESDDA